MTPEARLKDIEIALCLGYSVMDDDKKFLFNYLRQLREAREKYKGTTYRLNGGMSGREIGLWEAIHPKESE